MRSTSAPFVAALAFALAGAACQMSSEQPPLWQTGEMEVPSENVVWTVAGQELQRMGFPLGSDANPINLRMETGWKTSLAPFRGQGYRERAELQLTRLEGGRYRVEVRVAHEANNDLASPLDGSRAKWEATPDNVEAAQILLQRIRARLGAEFEAQPVRSQLPGGKN